ncbi:hypothetical protein RJ55_00926 [Drechmeria coniospora]|nr:hypothetical protein RJ55_00926 [Drechmeria coniospora]
MTTTVALGAPHLRQRNHPRDGTSYVAVDDHASPVRRWLANNAMATFNPMAAASAGDGMGLNSSQRMAMEHAHFGHDLGFDDALLDGSALAPLPPFTPAYEFDHFATTFEDPFAYSAARVFEPTPNPDAVNEESSNQELDNNLLGFSDPFRLLNLLDEAGNMGDMHMTAELYGMFFVAEDVFGGENAGRPLELTCYRRNLWQCSGQITLPRSVSQVVDEQGRRFPICELSASITALESIEGKATEIILIPWKSANAPGGEDTKVASAPPSIPLDLSTAQELDAHRVTLPVSWKRLQFKHATANNGRRKGLQQHYVVQINLLGRATSGEVIKIAEIQSGPVIVRGRSPRNFDSRKDVPLTGERRTERKGTAGSDSASVKMDRESVQPTTIPVFPSMDAASTSTEWANAQAVPQPNQSTHPSKKMAMSPTISKPPIPSWMVDGGSKSVGTPGGQTPHGSLSRQSSAVPINLSLSEEEKSPNRSSAELPSPQMGKFGSTSTAAGANPGSSPTEDPDPLYEYFPLTVDDWMPPVDAIYRPHVVHHTIVPPEVKAQQGPSRVKRYFTAD